MAVVRTGDLVGDLKTGHERGINCPRGCPVLTGCTAPLVNPANRDHGLLRGFDTDTQQSRVRIPSAPTWSICFRYTGLSTRLASTVLVLPIPSAAHLPGRSTTYVLYEPRVSVPPLTRG
jgi:hypothetical protein